MATSLNPISSSDSTPAIIGDIVERCSNVSIKQSSQTDAQRTRFSLENGFPKPSRIKRNVMRINIENICEDNLTFSICIDPVKRKPKSFCHVEKTAKTERRTCPRNGYF